MVLDILKCQKAARVCFSQNDKSKEARMRGSQTQTNQGQEVWGPEGWWEGGGGSPVEIRWDIVKICFNWLRSAFRPPRASQDNLRRKASTFEVPTDQNTTKIPREDPQREKKRHEKIPRERKKE